MREEIKNMLKTTQEDTLLSGGIPEEGDLKTNVKKHYRRRTVECRDV